MAKKAAATSFKSAAVATKTPAQAVKSPLNVNIPTSATPTPKPAPAPTPAKTAAPAQAPKREVTHQMIAERAYEIFSREGGSSEDNWYRAERELRDGK